MSFKILFFITLGILLNFCSNAMKPSDDYSSLTPCRCRSISCEEDQLRIRAILTTALSKRRELYINAMKQRLINGNGKITPKRSISSVFPNSSIVKKRSSQKK